MSVDRDVYLYRCYVAQRNYGLVLAETEGEKAQDPSIGAVRTLASFKKAGGDAALEKDAVDEVQRWIDAGTAAANATQQVVAATVLMARGRIDDAMKVLHNSLSLEAFVVSTPPPHFLFPSLSLSLTCAHWGHMQDGADGPVLPDGEPR